MTTSVIVWSVFLGALGMAYMSYGKRQGKIIASLGGLVLLVLPYFTTESLPLLASMATIIGIVYFFNY